MSTVEERVKKLICEQLGVKEEEVKADASFVDDLGADSLDTVELVMALEEEFETEIPDEEAEKLYSNQLSDKIQISAKKSGLIFLKYFISRILRLFGLGNTIKAAYIKL